MSKVSTRPRTGATKAPAKAKAAPTSAPVPAAPALRTELNEDDHCAIAVGNQISHLLLPIIDGPFAVDDIAGYGYITEANDHAWDLNNVEAEWNEPGPASTVAQLIPALQASLQSAMVEIVASTGKPTALMYCVRFLVAEALTVSNRLLDAYKGLPGSRSTLVALAESQTFHGGITPSPLQVAHHVDGPTADEHLVAATLRQQLMAIYHAPGNDLHSDSSELVHAAAEALANLSGGAYVALYRASALVAGAVAVERTTSPESAAVAQLQAVRQSLETASISYNCEMERGEEMAEGIRAGQRQFRDRPSPPIRRTDDTSDGPYNQAQLRSILTVIAGVAVTLDQVLMNAQASDSDWNTGVLIDAAQVLARHLGGMADNAVGGTVQGDHDCWNYGPNFAQEGKAGAA